MKLSVVITAFNESEKIADCLESVKNLNSEIVVVDNGSTDNTIKIAQKYTKKIYSQKNDPQNIDLQKNFGFTKAAGEWILSLDADEKITDELCQEIKSILSQERLESGFFVARKNILFGKWMQHTGWYPDYQLRLFKKGKAKFISKHVHENMQIDGLTENLKEPLIHENYQTISQFIKRNYLTYAPNEAQSLIDNGYKFSYFDVIWFPAKEFLSRFFAREGYKD
ncbi:MAG: glycosyltransferase family 2 protein, partial [Patescibacteria group bacterium]|nr:glycosyltransferase family 2 protein [Patescibacteria group bacterium]